MISFGVFNFSFPIANFDLDRFVTILEMLPISCSGIRDIWCFISAIAYRAFRGKCDLQNLYPRQNLESFGRAARETNTRDDKSASAGGCGSKPKHRYGRNLLPTSIRTPKRQMFSPSFSGLFVHRNLRHENKVLNLAL